MASLKIMSGLIHGVDTSESDMVDINKMLDRSFDRLESEDVFVRECWLTGDQVNCYCGQFRTGDLPKILKLTNGAPLSVGHDSSRLAIGKFFSGEVRERKGVNFIVPKMYWLRKWSGAEDLKTNIDGGVLREASIAWTYSKPTCSVCSKDIRHCVHLPGEKYEGKMCVYFYDGIDMVLEGSIVQRGGHPGTGFSKLGFSETEIVKEKITVIYQGVEYVTGKYNLEE